MKYILICLSTLIATSAWAQETPVIDIHNRLELFVDHFLIDRLTGAQLKLHQPAPAPPSDSPPSNGHYATVIKDGPVYRLYNRGGHSGFDGDPKETTHYFESHDGIHWTQPNLGIYTLNGSNNNNVILANDPPFSHNFSPFLDTRPGIPEAERYKALAGTQKSGLVAFASKDGIHWQKMGKSAVFTEGIFDSQNVVFWSEREEQYICYFRTWTGEGYTGLRTISRTTSKDFKNWTPPVALNPNVEGEHLYTSGTHPYFRAPHIYIALPTRFQPERGNATDILFMTARGGNPFDRTFLEAFIQPGLDDKKWANRANYAALNVVPTDPEEMSIYVRGERFVLRTDGFVSVRAGYEQGELITKPFVFSGDQLILNVATSAGGQVLVEIQDAAGHALPSFSIQNADAITADTTAYVASWQGRTHLSHLAGTPVRLRFVLNEADLFSMRFK